MSRWDRRDRWGWYEAAPKKPPPKRGVKMKKSGATWWGQRWVEALERMSRGYSNRLARGRTYARAGRTHDLVVKAGKVTAKVTGSGATPYTVTITLSRLSDKVWDQAIAAMARKAQFSAALLAGEMPQEVDAAFQEAGASVFPMKASDLATECSCPDWANPCKHVAATHYVLGEALDRDPFLLFELRGRTRAQVLEALGEARTGGGDEPPSRRGNRRPGTDRSEDVPAVSLGRVRAADYDEPRGPLPALHLSFEAAPIAGGVLRQLGTPPAWGGGQSPLEMLAPMIRAAAETARTLAMAEPEADVPPESAEADARRPPARAAGTRRARASAPGPARSARKGARPKAPGSPPAPAEATPAPRAGGRASKRSGAKQAAPEGARRGARGKAADTPAGSKRRAAKPEAVTAAAAKRRRSEP